MKTMIVWVMCTAAAIAGLAGAGCGGAQARELVAMQPRPNTDMDRTARTLVAPDLAREAQSGEMPLVLVAEVMLGGPKDPPALFVQLQSARACGSAGCSTSVYVMRQKQWRLVLDSIAGPVSVDTVRHGGMRDLIIDTSNRWIWRGDSYIDTKQAPAVNLRPGRKG